MSNLLFTIRRETYLLYLFLLIVIVFKIIYAYTYCFTRLPDVPLLTPKNKILFSYKQHLSPTKNVV